VNKSIHVYDLPRLSADQYRLLDVPSFCVANLDFFVLLAVRQLRYSAEMCRSCRDDLEQLVYLHAFDAVRRSLEKFPGAAGEDRIVKVIGALKHRFRTRLREEAAHLMPVSLHEGDPEALLEPDIAPGQRAPDTRATEGQSASYSCPGPETTLLTLEESRFEQARLDAYVESLRGTFPPNQFRIFRMRVVDGLSAREIAETFGCTRNNIYAILRTIRSRLEDPSTVAGDCGQRSAQGG